MSRNAKIALIVVGCLVVLCLGACGVGYFALQRFGQSFMNPQDARQTGAEIADYTLPEGYTEVAGMNLLVYKMVMIAPAQERQRSTGMFFMLMNTQSGAGDRQQMERQMQQAFQQQFNRAGGTTHVVGQEKVMIRGQDSTLTIAETDNTPQMRQAIGAFEGKSGLVIVMVMGDKDTWNDDLMRQFLGSIE